MLLFLIYVLLLVIVRNEVDLTCFNLTNVTWLLLFSLLYPGLILYDYLLSSITVTSFWVWSCWLWYQNKFGLGCPSKGCHKEESSCLVYLLLFPCKAFGVRTATYQVKLRIWSNRANPAGRRGIEREMQRPFRPGLPHSCKNTIANTREIARHVEQSMTVLPTECMYTFWVKMITFSVYVG